MRWPIENFDRKNITNGFSATHTANDLSAPAGTPIIAPDSGVVTAVNKNAAGYYGGMYIKMRGDSGYSFYMGHDSAVEVTTGQRVGEGQHIGAVGKTGFAVPSQGIAAPSGPHIHFEITKGSQVLDPSNVIEEGAKMPKVTINEWRTAAFFVLGRNGLFGSTNALDGSSDSDWADIWQHVDSGEVFIATLRESQEGKNWESRINNEVRNALNLKPSEAERKLQAIKDSLK